MGELISRCGMGLSVVTVGLGAPMLAAPDDPAPLEVVFVDVADFPRIAVDVALPGEELPGDVRADAFELPGAAAVSVEPLAPGELTVAVVLDDGPDVAAETIVMEQGVVTEMVRNVPPDVELLLSSVRGASVGPSSDRAAVLAAIGTVGTAAAGAGDSLTIAVLRVAALLEAAPDDRRHVVVVTGAGADVDAEQASLLRTSLDRSSAALRVLSIGAPPGATLSAIARATGGFAVDVGVEPGAALRAVDVLTTTFSHHYRVMGTMTAPGDQVVRLTMSDRTYETRLPDLRPPATTSTPTTAAPTTNATSTTASSTTTARSTTTTSAAPAAIQGPPSATLPVRPNRPDRSPSTLTGAQGIVALVVIALLVMAFVRRSRRHAR